MDFDIGDTVNPLWPKWRCRLAFNREKSTTILLPERAFPLEANSLLRMEAGINRRGFN